MPAKNHRVNVTLERPLYDALVWLARGQRVSLSRKARDLLRDALETYEDLALAAEERERTERSDAAQSSRVACRGPRYAVTAYSWVAGSLLWDGLEGPSACGSCLRSPSLAACPHPWCCLAERRPACWQ